MKPPKIKISFSFLIMLLALVFSHSYLSLAALLAALLHELGHMAAAALCKVPLRELKLGIFGASLTLDGALCSYKKEIFLAAAGPAVNIFTVALMLPHHRTLSEPLALFFTASAFLGALNLLPVADFDGGRILSCILSQSISPRASAAICGAVSFITVLGLWMLSAYLLLRLGASLSLFVFSSALFCRIFTSQNP